MLIGNAKRKALSGAQAGGMFGRGLSVPDDIMHPGGGIGGGLPDNQEGGLAGISRMISDAGPASPRHQTLGEFVSKQPINAGMSPADQIANPANGQTMGSVANRGGLIGSGRRQMLQRPEAPAPEKRSKHIFGKRGIGWDIMGVVGDALAMNSGGQPIYARQQQQQRALKAQQAKTLADRQWQYDMAMQKRDWQTQDDEAKRNAPQPFMSNGDRVIFNPVTGQAEKVYDGQEAFEDYAEALGYEPGTPEYFEAVQDAMLKSSGPTAHGFDVQMDNVRTNNDIRYKGVPTYRQQNPAPRAGGGRRGRSRPVKVKSGEQSITTADGRKQVVRNGAWVDAQ